MTETIRLNRLCWFGCVQRMEENRIPERVLCMNLETRLRLMEKGGRKKYKTERNRRSFREQQGIVAFCTCQWDE